MVQEMANAENAMKEELARCYSFAIVSLSLFTSCFRLQKLEDIAVKLCRDCGELPPRISALADQYKEVCIWKGGGGGGGGGIQHM